MEKISKMVKEKNGDSNDSIYKFELFQCVEVVPIVGPIPRARSGHRIIHYKGTIYSVGGFNPFVDTSDHELMQDIDWNDFPLFKELWELNLATKRWTKTKMKGDIPEHCASASVVTHPLHPNVMLIYGGTGFPFGFDISNEVTTCELLTQKFSKLTVSEEGAGLPMALYGQAVITDEERGLFYTVGGTSGMDFFMDVNVLDLRASPPRWSSLYRCTELEEEPKARYRHELCLYQDKLYVLGGGTGASAESFQELPTFDLKEKRWCYTRTKPDTQTTTHDNSNHGFPRARRCHGAVQVGNQAFVVGGYDGEQIFGDSWILNMDTLQWRRMKLELPHPVYFHAVTVTKEGKLIIFGGVDNIEQNTRTNKVFTTWLTIPSLKNMAWEAVCHYTPNIAQHSKNTLLKEGIPSDCLETLSNSSCKAAVVG